MSEKEVDISGQIKHVRPLRIQRKRRRGYDMQAESMALNGLPAVSVCRGGKWGNQFRVVNFGREWFVYDSLSYQHSRPFKTKQEAATEAVSLFWYVLVRKQREHLDEFLAPLKGKNLACFCSLGDPCHADVLLRLANQATE